MMLNPLSNLITWKKTYYKRFVISHNKICHSYELTLQKKIYVTVVIIYILEFKVKKLRIV